MFTLLAHISSDAEQLRSPARGRNGHQTGRRSRGNPISNPGGVLFGARTPSASHRHGMFAAARTCDPQFVELREKAIPTSASPSCTQGRSRVREFRLHGFSRNEIAPPHGSFLRARRHSIISPNLSDAAICPAFNGTMSMVLPAPSPPSRKSCNVRLPRTDRSAKSMPRNVTCVEPQARLE